MNLNYMVKLSEDENWVMPKHHYHQGIEVLLCVTNSGKIFIEDKVYPLNRGTLLVINETTLHRTIVNPNRLYKRYIIHFPLETLDILSTQKSNLNDIMANKTFCTQLSDQCYQDLVDMLDSIANTSSDEFGQDIISSIKFANVLVYISRLIINPDHLEHTSSLEFKRVLPIINYIQDHITEDLSLNKLSEVFYVSKYHLSKIFKHSTGFTINEFIIQKRILLAKDYLKNGFSVQYSGEKSGFNDYSHFIRTFSKSTGISPGRYAKEFKT